MRQLQRPLSKRSPACLDETCARPRSMRPADNSTACRCAAIPRLRLESSFSPSRSRCVTLRPTRNIPTAPTSLQPIQTTLRSCGRVSCHITWTQSSGEKRKAKSTTSTPASNSGECWRQTPTSEPSSLRTRRGIATKVVDADFMRSVLESFAITIQNKGVNRARCATMASHSLGRLGTCSATYRKNL
jgi:hypothetical protein